MMGSETRKRHVTQATAINPFCSTFEFTKTPRSR
jgi:hypothetical protein